MGKLNDLMYVIADKYTDKSKQDKQDQIRVASLVRRILELSNEYLDTADASFIFEVTPDNAQYMLSVLGDARITDRYEIKQLALYLYSVRLKTFSF